ncbi:MAG: cellulase family glycosylhydrolase [Phycisphaerales bacterium]
MSGCVAVGEPAPGLPGSDVDLRVQGADLVDAQGEVVILRAINLGNWLLIEPWMYNQNTQFVPDQASFIGVLESRFGAEEARRLMDLHRAGFMTQRDFDAVANAGFNCVRIPVSHKILESDPLVIDEAGFDVLRDAMDMAAQAGLYVILDMHSVPGGQSLDQPSGDVTKNDLWTDEAAQERLAWLWQQVARRFKNTPNFVAYDLINEPFGDFSTDIRDELVDIADQTISAIREVDPDRLIFVPGTIEGIRFYGDPADRGWTNVGFTEHFYPGLFDGSPPTLGTHARFAASTLRDRADLAEEIGVPFFWGEFNPVFDRAGAPDVTRVLFDQAENLGLHAGVWSLKLITQQGGLDDNNWYMTTNAVPSGLGDIRTSSKATIETVFSSLGFMPLVTDLAYVSSLTGPAPSDVLPAVEIPPLTAPESDAWTNWSLADVGDVARVGGQQVLNGKSLGADALTIYAAGKDLFGRADSMRLASRQMPPEFLVSGVFEAFEGDRFSQAGVTIRSTELANSPHLSLVAFSDGRVLVKARSVGGGTTGQRYIATAGFPVGLAIGRDNGSFTAWMTDEDGQWRAVPLSESPNLGTSPRAGFFGVANRAGPLSVFEIDEPSVTPPGTFATATDLDTGSNLLANASFETSNSWNFSGGNIGFENGWTPVRDGSRLLAYRHWQVNSSSPSEASQLITGLVPGESYTFTVYANRDSVAAGQSTADRVELRVETDGDPVRWLESIEYEGVEIATGSRWSRMQVRFVALDSEHRVRIVAYPGSGNRDGAVKFDGLVVEADPG